MKHTEESKAAALAYRKTLPQTPNKRGVTWTLETADKFLSLLYPGLRLAPGQEWKGTGKKHKFICPIHGDYETEANAVMSTKECHSGSGCKKCSLERVKGLHEKTRASFVGQTTQDGLVVLEHVGYHATPSQKKKGKKGCSIFRFRCPVCGNEEKTGLIMNLKKPGQTTHCGCLGKKDSRLKFSRSKTAAKSPCFIYLFSTVGTSAMKVGIAKDVRRRASKGKNSYENELYVSQELHRADAWAVEQVMLHRLRIIGLTFDLENVPAWSEIQEAGGSEVFAMIDFIDVETQIRSLIREVKELGWEQLLDRYIPIEEMTHHQLLRWNGKRVIQSNGDGYLGQPYSSVFDL